ncbi:unknown [Clostridium sp. CAG:575]|nr:unknown [Clostridium sp. CAG:575]
MKNSSKGITLIALIITIIILLILAGVTISQLTENGLLYKAIKAKDQTQKMQAKEELESVLIEAAIEKQQNEKYNSNDFLNQFIISKISGAQINENNVLIKKYTFLIDRELLKIISVEEIQNNEEKTESLISKISEIQSNGYSTVKLKVKDNEGTEKIVEYNIHTIIYNGNLILDGISNIEGATLSNNVYEFGSKTTDVATENENAKNMVVLKVKGNLTINEGITLTACKSDDGYGGPKGMMIYCTGTLTNNGIVSMTARGAKAEGENVYLWQNLDNSYEYIPAVGATGGESITKHENQSGNGINGYVGNGRQTGGGGSGAANASDADPIAVSGAGGNGTSYSGGAGGGGCNINCYSKIKAEDGSSTGGKGGDGIGYRYSSSWASRLAGGGAGNPGGNGGQNDSGNAIDGAGENGTGGLLIIYSDNINNTGKIESNGSKGTLYTMISGGSSGGGSINIFYKNNITCTGPIEAKGGKIKGSADELIGGNGGNGTISIGNISSGTYQSDTGNISLKEDKIELIKIQNEEVLGNNGNKIESKTEYNIDIEEKPYSAQIIWKSSDENIVTVNQNGKIKFINPGIATITCTAKTKIGIEYTDSCEITAIERLYLYYYGNQFTSITGGYEKYARTGRRFSATFNNDNIYIDCNAGYGGGGVFTVNSIDLTQYKYLKSYGQVASWATNDSAGRLMATTTSKTWGSSYVPDNSVTVSSTGKTAELLILTHDIESLQSSYYISNGFNQSHGYLYEIWLEK